MSERTLEPPELGRSLDLSSVGGPAGDDVLLTWATAEGRPVVVKSTRGRHRARLRREAEALGSVSGPGVVDLLAVQDDEARTSLVLADAGHRTLADPAGLGSDALLRALARTCAAIERLHRLGWTHGRLEAQHVIVGARGRVQLCSFAAARPIGPPADTAADVAALLELCRAVAAELDGRDRRDARTARRLRSLADELEASPDLDARRLIEALDALRRTPRRRGVCGTRPEGPWRRRRRPLAGDPPTSGSIPRAVRTTAVTIALAGVATAAAVALPGAGSADPAVVALPEDRSADSGDPDAPRAQAAPAPTVVLDGRSYRVGLPGDRAVVGDWDCDGAATVRLLRPGTGELFEFGSPDPTGAPTTARVRSVHPGAVDLIAKTHPDADGCHDSVLLGPDDRRQEIP